MAPSHFLESGPIIASVYVMGSSLSNNNMSRCSVVRSVNFSVTRCALIDLRGLVLQHLVVQNLVPPI
jgi:hypothetical protein